MQEDERRSRVQQFLKEKLSSRKEKTSSLRRRGKLYRAGLSSGCASLNPICRVVAGHPTSPDAASCQPVDSRLPTITDMQ